MAEMEVSPQEEMANPQRIEMLAVERRGLPEDFVFFPALCGVQSPPLVYAPNLPIVWGPLQCYVHFYATFFVGVSNVAIIPLVFVDVFKHFPELSARYPGAKGMLRIAFVALFIPLRLWYWFYVATLHVYDTLWSVKWYWGYYLIVRATVETISGKTTKKKDA